MMKTNEANIRTEVAEEADMIELQGGEIPEVAMFDGLENLRLSGIQPTSAESALLERAVLNRYRDIIFRDLDPANRDRPEFRTPERAMINWRRLCLFADKKGIDIQGVRSRAGIMLKDYLTVEADEISGGKRHNTLGLMKPELMQFIDELELNKGEIQDLSETVTAVPTRKYGR